MIIAASFLNFVRNKIGINISSIPVNWCTNLGYGIKLGTIGS